MTTLKKTFPAFLVTILLLFPTFQNVQAKDNGMEDWLTETGNPAINNIVTDFNNTTQVNWYVNLSNHLIEGDNKKTIEKLGVLRDDITSMKKDVKDIKAPKSASKKDKKQIKAIKTNLTKSLNQTDASAKKLTKRVDKDKKIKVIKPRKNELKNMSKVNAAYVELNDSYSVDTPPLKLVDAVKIDQEVAEKIVHDYNEEQKEIAAKKAEEKKKEEAKEEAEKKRLAEEKAAEEEAKRLEEEKKAEELAQAEQQKAEEEEQARIAQEEKDKQQENTSEPERFQNCTELRKKYPNGVASDHPAYQSKMDRDKDNWACER